MEDKQAKPGLNMAIMNGVILGLIGLLVLITPLAEPLGPVELAMDLVAGGLLLAGGTGSLTWGVLRMRRAARRASGEER